MACVEPGSGVSVIFCTPVQVPGEAGREEGVEKDCAGGCPLCGAGQAGDTVTWESRGRTGCRCGPQPEPRLGMMLVQWADRARL